MSAISVTRPFRPKGRMRRFAGACTLALALIPFGLSEAFAQDLRSRVERLQQELQTLQRAVYGGRTGSASQGGAAGGDLNRPQAARIELRLNQLETEIRSLTGQVEELTFNLDRMSQRFEGFVVTVDQRLQRLERPPAATLGAAEPQAGTLAGQVLGAGQASSASQASSAGQAPASGQQIPQATQPQAQSGVVSQPATFDRGPKVIGAVPAANLETLRQRAAQGTQTSASSSSPTAASPQQGQVAAAATQEFASPQAQYDHAFGLLSQANYPAAESALASFLERYPSDPLAGNAKYWLGETHYVRGQYREAAVTFAEGYQSYPNSTKAPDNLLKLGKSLSALGQTQDACGTLAELLSRYAGAAPTILQQAKLERQKLSCP